MVAPSIPTNANMRVAAMLASRGRKLATHSWGAGGVFMQITPVGG